MQTDLNIHDPAELKKAAEELARQNLRLNESLAALKRSQAKVFHQEKMASIGQFAAGVSHEIGSPIGFIDSNLSTLGKYLSRLTGFLAIQSECIAAGSPPEKVESVRRQHANLKIDYIVKDLGEIPRTRCCPRQMIRVFMNLLVNAAHAIEDRGSSPSGPGRRTGTSASASPSPTPARGSRRRTWTGSSSHSSPRWRSAKGRERGWASASPTES